MKHFFLALIFISSALISHSQIKTSEEMITIFESTASSLDQALEKFKLKYHTTTSNVKVFKGDYQQVYITFDENNQIKEVLLRNNIGYNLKSVEKSVESSCKLVTKEKRRRVYSGEKYLFTFVNNDSKYEVTINLK